MSPRRQIVFSLASSVLCWGLIFCGPALSARLTAADAPAEKEAAIDWERAQGLHRREQQGEKLAPDDQAYLDRAKKLVAAGKGPGRAGPRAADKPVGEPKLTLGLKPLVDMTADDQYQGQDGGLYGRGQNEPPAEHRAVALREAAKIEPLDSQGKPDQAGQIVLISVGMSNTTQEFSRFMKTANSDAEKSPRVTLVDGAQGGQETTRWANVEAPWAELARRLDAAHVAPAQVQVAWIKLARANPAASGPWPKHNEVFEKELAEIVVRLKKEYPNLRIAYLSSRIYAGNANTPLNPEPYAYENGFAVRHLIGEQIRGADSLNFDAKRGAVHAPLLLWGPYLWADGETPRKLDGLTWQCADLGKDGTHPSPSGAEKVAELLLKFLKNDPTAKPWFAKAKP